MKTKIYIAGKITGDPEYKAKFEAAAEAYKKKGYTVLNPSWMPQGMRPADYMRICFAMIDTADVVVFLPDYLYSSGAMLEHQYACYVDKCIKYHPSGQMSEIEFRKTVVSFGYASAANLADYIKKCNKTLYTEKDLEEVYRYNEYVEAAFEKRLLSGTLEVQKI